MNSADKIRAEQIRSAKESRCQAGASGDLIARAKTLQSTFSGVRDDPLAHTWVTRYRSLIAAVKHLSPREDPRPIETPRGDNGGHVRSVVALRANTRVWAKAWSPTQGPGNIWSFWSDLDQRPWINLQNLSKWMSYKYLKPVRGECVCVEPDGTTCIIFSGNTWILKQGANPPKYIRTAADHSEFHKLALRRKQRAVTFSRVKHKDVTERRQTSALQESHILPLRQRWFVLGSCK